MFFVIRRLFRVSNTRTRAQLESLLDLLTEMSPENLAFVTVLLTATRLKYLNKGIDLFTYVAGGKCDGVVLRDIGRYTRQQRRENNVLQEVSGMVWLASLGANDDPALRPLRGAMWAALRAGFPHIEAAIEKLKLLGMRHFDADEARKAPDF